MSQAVRLAVSAIVGGASAATLVPMVMYAERSSEPKALADAKKALPQTLTSFAAGYELPAAMVGLGVSSALIVHPFMVRMILGRAGALPYSALASGERKGFGGLYASSMRSGALLALVAWPVGGALVATGATAWSVLIDTDFRGLPHLPTLVFDKMSAAVSPIVKAVASPELIMFTPIAAAPLLVGGALWGRVLASQIARAASRNVQSGFGYDHKIIPERTTVASILSVFGIGLGLGLAHFAYRIGTHPLGAESLVIDVDNDGSLAKWLIASKAVSPSPAHVHACARRDQAEALKAFLDAGVPINAELPALPNHADKCVGTALHVAARYRAPNAARELLARSGPSATRAKDSTGRTPVGAALDTRNPVIDPAGLSAFLRVVAEKDPGAISRDPAVQVYMCESTSNNAVIATLIELGAGVNYRPRRDLSLPIMSVIGRSRKTDDPSELVDLLISRGASVNVTLQKDELLMKEFDRPFSAFQLALARKADKTAATLLRKGAKTNLGDETFFVNTKPSSDADISIGSIVHYMAANDMPETLSEYVSRAWRPAALVNAPAGVRGATPLHAAVVAGSESCISALLAAGADPKAATLTDAGSEQKLTPLDMAAKLGKQRVVEILSDAAARKK